MSRGRMDMPPGPGRTAGVPNKATILAKQAMQLAFEGIGGVPSLIKWATENPTDFYKLYSKLIPAQVDIAATHNFVVAVPAIADNAEAWKQQHPQVTIQAIQ